MGRILITSLVIYLLYVVGYLAWERRGKRRRNGARQGGADQKRASPPEDIMGKSRFELRHSRPQATTLAKSEKREENDSTFADGKDEAGGSKASVAIPAAIPKEKLDKAFSSPPAPPSETDSSVDRETDSATDPATDSATDSDTDPPTDPDEVDYAIDDTPEAGEIEGSDGTEADGEKESVVDSDESENADGSDEDADDAAANGIAIAMATGLSFHELSGMSRTVNDPDAATAEQRHEAGRVLVEVRQTDMFEQIVSGPPQKRRTAGTLMDDYFAAWHRRRREADGDNDQQAVRTPTDFDPRAFARL